MEATPSKWTCHLHNRSSKNSLSSIPIHKAAEDKMSGGRERALGMTACDGCQVSELQ